MKTTTKLFALALASLVAFVAVQRNATACEKNKKSKTSIESKANGEKNQIASTKAGNNTVK